MSKLTVSIGAKDFDIKLDGEFAQYFEESFKESFGESANIEVKELLWAYVQKCYDEYLNTSEVKKLLDEIENI